MASRGLSLRKAQQWDEDAQPGDSVVYYTHRRDALVERPTPAFHYLWEAAEDGLTILTQKRYGDGTLSYIATRISPRTRRYLDSISPPVSRISDREDV